MRSERGQTLVEFALIMPILIIAGLGVTEAGYALLDKMLAGAP